MNVAGMKGIKIPSTGGSNLWKLEEKWESGMQKEKVVDSGVFMPATGFPCHPHP